MKFIQTGEFQYFYETINTPNRRIDGNVISIVNKNCHHTKIIDILKDEKFEKENEKGIKNYIQIIEEIIKMNENKKPIEIIIKFLTDKLIEYLRCNFKKHFNQKWEDLNELYETAKRIEIDSMRSPIDNFIDYIESLIDRSTSRNTDDSIRISTLHRSKGILDYSIYFNYLI